MNTHKFYFVCQLFIFLALFMSSCEKDSSTSSAVTVIAGTVIDATTGEPLDSVGIVFSINKGVDKSTGYTIYDYRSVQTDATGHFSSSTVSNGTAAIGVFLIKKNGYITKGGSNNIDIGDLVPGKDVVISIIPTDGTLHLNVLNPSGISDTVYYAVYSPAQLKESTISYGKMYSGSMDMSLLNQYQLDFAVASGEQLTIYWNFDRLPSRFQDYPFKDTITVAKNGVTPFTITF